MAGASLSLYTHITSDPIPLEGRLIRTLRPPWNKRTPFDPALVDEYINKRQRRTSAARPASGCARCCWSPSQPGLTARASPYRRAASFPGKTWRLSGGRGLIRLARCARTLRRRSTRRIRRLTRLRCLGLIVSWDSKIFFKLLD